MTKQKIKNFIKEHKKEILIGTGLAVIGGVVYVFTKKQFKPDIVQNVNWDMLSIRPEEQARIEAFNCGVGTVSDMWNEGGALNFIINDITIDELGLLGQEFKKLDEVSDKTTVSLIVGLVNEK